MSLVKVNDLESKIKTDKLLQDIEDTLFGLEQESDRDAIKDWLYSKVDDFVKRCGIVQEDEEISTLLMWFYIQLKSEWSQLNTEIQYQPMASDEPDMVLIFKASTLSQLLASIENILRYVDVERAVDFLADPIWKMEKLDRFYVQNKQQDALVLRSEDQQASQIQVLEVIKETSTLLELEKGSIGNSYNKLKSKLEQVQSRFVQLTNNSNVLRLGIIELRQTQAVELYERLDRFFQEAQQSFGVWGEFSVGGGNILIERQTIDLLIEPYTQIIRMIMRVATNFQEEINMRLRVRFAGRKLKTGIRIKSDNSDFITELEQLVYSETYQEIDKLISTINGKFNVVQKKSGEIEFLTTRHSNSNVMEDAIIFEAGNLVAGIPSAFVGQLVGIEEKAMKKVTTHQTLVQRDAVYPYLPLNTLLGSNSSDKETVAILVDRSGKRLALGVSKVIGIETVSLQPLGAYESESPMVQSIGVTGSGLILNFLDMGMLFDYDQMIQS